MDLLNLDTLVEVDRQVTIGGETYNIAKQTVGQTLQAIELSKLDTSKADSGEKVFVAMVTAAQQAIPDCPSSVIEGLNIDQLSALLEFASASGKDVVEGSEAEAEEEEGK